MENAKPYPQVVLSLLYWLGLLGAYASTSSETGRILVLAAGAAFFLFYIQRFRQGQRVEKRSELFVHVTAFLVFVSLWSVNFFFSPEWWLVLLSAAVLTFLLSAAVFYTTLERSRLTLYASVSALLLTETAWVLLFWPAHFLTLAVVLFSVFYLIYNLTILYHESRLDRNRVWFLAGIVLVILTLMLISSPWSI